MIVLLMVHNSDFTTCIVSLLEVMYSYLFIVLIGVCSTIFVCDNVEMSIVWFS